MSSVVVIVKYALAMVTSKYKEIYYFTGTVITVTPVQLKERGLFNSKRKGDA